MALHISTDGEFEDDPSPQSIDWLPFLKQMLEPYEPVARVTDADKWFTTAEIMSQLEQHFSIPQSDAKKAGMASMMSGEDLVTALSGLGFTTHNMGGLGLHWLMKKKA